MSVGAFFARRVRRLLPMLALTLSLDVRARHRAAQPARRRSRHCEDRCRCGAARTPTRSWRAADDYFALAPESNALLHTWSLSVEEQFYLVLPLVVLVGLARCVVGRLGWAPTRRPRCWRSQHSARSPSSSCSHAAGSSTRPQLSGSARRRHLPSTARPCGRGSSWWGRPLRSNAYCVALLFPAVALTVDGRGGAGGDHPARRSCSPGADGLGRPVHAAAGRSALRRCWRRARRARRLRPWCLSNCRHGGDR